MGIANTDERWSACSVAQLLEHLLPSWPDEQRLSIIGIDGRSRAGKSTLAEQIATVIDNVAVIHTDDIAWHHSFFGWSDTLIMHVLQPLSRTGAPLSFTPQAWTERGRPGAIDVPAGTRVVLVEGVGATRSELHNWLDATIWVETNPAEALRRTKALDRDPPGFVEDWMRAEEEHLNTDKPWARAAVWVSGEVATAQSLYVRFRDPSPVDSHLHISNSQAVLVDGLLLDNDGVLVDSHDAAAIAWNQWAAQWAPGFDFHRDIEHGVRLRDIVARLVPTPHVDEAAQQLLDLEMDLTSRVPPVPGARDLTTHCPPRSWAVVTSGVRAIAEARLNAARIPKPSAIIAAGDTLHGKPAPDPYLAGAAALNLAPPRCAVFEDAKSGIEAARAAGIGYVVGVGKATLNSDIDVAVSSLSGIRFDGTRLTIPAKVILAK